MKRTELLACFIYSKVSMIEGSLMNCYPQNIVLNFRSNFKLCKHYHRHYVTVILFCFSFRTIPGSPQGLHLAQGSPWVVSVDHMWCLNHMGFKLEFAMSKESTLPNALKPIVIVIYQKSIYSYFSWFHIQSTKILKFPE